MKLLRWLIINTAFVALGYYGFIHNYDWARRGFLFMFWISVGMSTFMLNDKIRNSAAQDRPSIPYQLDALYDFSCCIALAALGHWILAAAWFWQMLMCACIHNRREELAKSHEVIT